MKTVFYYRAATKEQTTESQERECMKMLGVNDKLVGVYEDFGYSGLNETRPSLIKLIEDSKSGKFQKIITSQPSVLFRNVAKMIELKEKIEQYGVKLEAANGSFDTDDLTNSIAIHLSRKTK
ncbi:recombinase family protein [Paenibacillus sp. LK1]|uniref:recombinase family protein n=1 Tax=Paenibacillus sp. LK1 TaxID=2053014 RepID=UPI000C181AC5|nr:recombinase family protein [Paenibacillus sp. LK1]PIH59058.1 hypothetical protein CS562_14035 [Paenibacillus sp. LK1]